MYKRIVILIAISFLFQLISAPGKDPEQKVKGGFRECKKYQYYFKSGEINKDTKKLNSTKRFNDKGNIIEEIIFNDDGSELFEHIYKYNDQGGQLERKITQSKGGKKIYNEVIYKYNHQSDQLEKSICQSKGGKIVYNEVIYKYDDKGNNIQIVNFSSDSSFFIRKLLKYNDKGNLIESIVYHKKGSPSYKYTYRYDDKGNMIEYIVYNLYQLNLDTNQFKYNDNGKYNKELPYTPDSLIMSKTIYKYDNKGNITEEILNVLKMEDVESRVNDTIITTYKYNEFDNIIEEIYNNHTSLQKVYYEYIYSK